MDLNDFDKKLFKKPAYRKEYKKYDLAFEISQMLIEARIIKGITQDKLAKMIRTQQSSIARAENGTVLPKISFLKKIADAFHTYLIVKFAFMDKSNVKVSEKSSTSHYTQLAYASTPQPVLVHVTYKHSYSGGGFGI